VQRKSGTGLKLSKPQVRRYRNNQLIKADMRSDTQREIMKYMKMFLKQQMCIMLIVSTMYSVWSRHMSRQANTLAPSIKYSGKIRLA